MNKNTKQILIVCGVAMAVIFILVMVIGTFGGNNSGATYDEAPRESESLPTETATYPERDNQVVLSFIGDCILGSESGKSNYGNFTWTAENKPLDYFFQKVKGVLSEDDLTFSNMECVLSDRELEKTAKDYTPAFWFTAPTKNADILTLGSVEVAGVVNNHTFDYGEEGYKDTVKALEDKGLFVGENLSPLYFDIKGMRIGVLYCNLWSEYSTYYIEQTLQDMQGECDYKIVFFHGGTEAVHEPDNFKIEGCRYLAENKLCDLIVGSHPHVLQPMEIVNGVPIVYSLGNFCYSANTYPENKTIIFQVMLSKDGDKITTATRIVPCYVYTGSENNYQPAVIEDANDKAEIMNMMNAPVEIQEETSESTAESSAETTSPPEQDVYVPEETLPQDPVETVYEENNGDISDTIVVQY